MITTFKIMYCALIVQLGLFIAFGLPVLLMVTMYFTIGILMLTGILIFLKDMKDDEMD